MNMVNRETIEAIIRKVLIEKLGDGAMAASETAAAPAGRNPLVVSISARHIHLTDADVETLFGKGKTLTKMKDLYLDGFPEEMRKEAREMLELCLKNYPNSRRTSMVKCRLAELYDAGNSRRAELVKQLKNDNSLPNVLKSSLN